MLETPILKKTSLNSDGGGKWYDGDRAVMTNFLMMTIAFAINHGTVTAALNFMSTALGTDIGSYSIGILYVMYTLTALLFAAGVVRQFGAKWSVTSSLLVYTLYVGSFFLALWTMGKDKQPTKLTWVVALVGGFLGGLGAGWLWTAQGIFFGRSAKLYAKAAGLPLIEVNSLFAGIFSTMYVGLEVVIKVIAGPLVSAGPKVMPGLGDYGFMALVYTVLAGLSVFIMFFVRDVPDLAQDPNNGETQTGYGMLRKAKLAGELFVRDRKIRLLGVLQAAFGFTAAFVIGYVNSDVVPIALKNQPLSIRPYVFTTIPFVAAAISLPMTKAANSIGKGPLMMMGACAYALLSLIVTVLNKVQLGELGLGIVVIYLLMGFGRAVFENTNKAVFADFFPEDTEAAFANVIVMSGGSSALAFFIFPHLSKYVKGSITCITSVCAIFALYLAFKQYKSEQVLKKLEEDNIEYPQ